MSMLLRVWCLEMWNLPYEDEVYPLKYNIVFYQYLIATS